jgi:hypothetical protein
MKLTPDQLKKIASADAEMLRAADGLVGGSAERNAILEWARLNLSTEDRADYQAGLSSPETSLEAISSLKRLRDQSQTEVLRNRVKAAGGFASHGGYLTEKAMQVGGYAPVFLERVRNTPEFIITGTDE